jgi:hypothetical protein
MGSYLNFLCSFCGFEKSKRKFLQKISTVHPNMGFFSNLVKNANKVINNTVKSIPKPAPSAEPDFGTTAKPKNASKTKTYESSNKKYTYQETGYDTYNHSGAMIDPSISKAHRIMVHGIHKNRLLTQISYYVQ